MPSNLKDVAKKLDISIATVSRVVNNKGYVKAETRERVLAALKELDYTPNMVARSLKCKTTKTIGVLIPDITEPFFDFVIKGIDSVLRESGCSMILCDTDEDVKKEVEYLGLLAEKQIDGVILATVSPHSEFIDGVIERRRMPVVFIDNLPNTSKNIDAVIIDNRLASRMAVGHLIECGHKNIGIITGKTDETTGYERLAGYREALGDNGIEVRESLIRVGDYKEDSGYGKMLELLESNPDMTAVYVISSKMTYGAVKAIRSRGLRIPDDIAVVGFDIHDASGLMSPGITTVMQPERTIGREAAELVTRLLESDGEDVHRKMMLSPELVVRDSSGK